MPEIDNTPDAALVESNERARTMGARTLSPEEAMSALLGTQSNDVESNEPADSSAKVNDAARRHPDPTQAADDSTSDQPDVESSDSSEVPEGEDQSQITDSKESTDKEAADHPDIGDLFIGLGDDDELSINVRPTAKPGYLPPAAKTGELSDADRASLWRSTADKRATEIDKLKKENAALMKERDDLSSVIAQYTAGTKQFDKRVKDFMEEGEEFIHDERLDLTTPSGIAYRRYTDALKSYEKDQLKAEIKAEAEMERRRQEAEKSSREQIDYLRSKRGNEFRTDAEIEELIDWSTKAGKKALYLLSIVRDLSNGTFKLPAKAAAELLRVTSGNGNGKLKTTIASKPSATPERKQSVDPDAATLSKFFPDAQSGLYTNRR